MSETVGTDGVLERPDLDFVPVTPVPGANNLFFQAEKFANAVRNQVALVPISYERDGVLIPTLNATPGRTVFVYTDQFNQSQRKESRDFLINAVDLVFGDVIREPLDGDIIVEDTLTQRFTYEVGAWNGEPHWRYSGIYRQVVRVHTKLVKKEGI